MYLFLLLAIPCFLSWYLLSLREFKFANFMPQAMIGIFTSIVLCLILEFFVFTGFVFTASFGQIFIYHYMNESLIPIVVLYGFFLLISIGKDNYKYKVNCFAPLMLSFYLVYLPYLTLSDYTRHSLFLNFMKPLLYICQIWLMQESMDFGYRMLSVKKDLKGIIFLVLPLLFTPIAPLVETMWYLQLPVWAITLLSILFMAGPVAEYVLVQRKGDDFVLFAGAGADEVEAGTDETVAGNAEQKAEGAEAAAEAVAVEAENAAVEAIAVEAEKEADAETGNAEAEELTAEAESEDTGTDADEADGESAEKTGKTAAKKGSRKAGTAKSGSRSKEKKDSPSKAKAGDKKKKTAEKSK